MRRLKRHLTSSSLPLARGWELGIFESDFKVRLRHSRFGGEIEGRGEIASVPLRSGTLAMTI